MTKFLLGALMVGALSVSPSLLNAQDHDHDQADQHSENRTYQDKAHHDTHEWNDNENANWSRYREQHHIKEYDFSKASQRQQQAYWNYRHEHGDSH